jgi:TonB family protein
MVVRFQKLKIRFALIFALILCAAVLSSSASAQKPKPKENSNPKICTGGVINSKVTFEAKPIYPKGAREARAEGQVIVRVQVGETGKVYEATACAGHKLLQQAAVDAAYQTQIKPTVLSGKAVKVTNMLLLYVFKIEEEKGRLVEIKTQHNKSTTTARGGGLFFVCPRRCAVTD